MENILIYTWLGLMLVLITIEAITISLTTIWLAAGALVAFFLALFNVPLWLQISAFLAVSIILIVFTRPVAVKYLKVGGQKTNTDLLIGTNGIVIADINEFTTGQVKVKGQIWTAVSNMGESITKATEVIIEGIEGVKLIVSASLNN